MKKYSDILLYATLAAIMYFAAGCAKEPPVKTGANFEIVTQEPFKAGEAITFKITDDADFLTFYTGEKNAEYVNYPKDKGMAVSKSFSYTYSATGTYELTLLANSYGEQGTQQKSAKMSRTIKVIDTRTGFSQFDIVKPELKGKIDNVKGEVNFDVLSSQEINNLVPNFFTISSGAKVYLNGVEAVAGAPVDFSKDTLYKVVAPNGNEQAFRIIFNRLPADTSKQLLTLRASTLNRNGVIDQETKRVDLALPAGTNLAAVKLAGTSSGKSVIKINNKTITQAGVTVSIAAQPTTVSVIAESGEVQNYALYSTAK